MTSTLDNHTSSSQISATGLRLVKRIAAATLIGLIVLVRVMYPGSDAYARLTWSSALLTDEGFYIHNARNLILFGHMRTDEFNNALIMPLLHLVQVLVFRIWGVGAMQARSISVVFSLLTLLVLWDALRRAWSLRCAWLGVLLLGLDPAFALYNRLALMDTPACLPLCASFWLWTVAQTRRQGDRETRGQGDAVENDAQQEAEPRLLETQQSAAAYQEQTQQTAISFISLYPCLPVSLSSLLPLFLCGLCLGLAYCMRGLTAVVAPVPMLLLAQQAWRKYQQTTGNKEQGTVRKHGKSPCLLFSSSPLLALLAGLTLVLLAYAVLWYWPNKAEMAHDNRFYLHEQLLPHSAAKFCGNLWTAVSHRHRGVLPFLLKHSPVLLLLSGCWLLRQMAWICPPIRDKVRAAKYAAAGLLAFHSAHDDRAADVDCCATEYDVTTSSTFDESGRRQCAYFLTGWLLVFLVFVSVVDYAPSRYYVMFYPFLAGLAAIMLDTMLREAGRIQKSHTRRFLAFLVLAWMCLNGYWYADWLGHLTYKQQAADTWLATHLPANSVLLGAVSPGICLNNHFKCVVMIDNLCNYHAPVEKFASAPRYVVILDTDSDVERSLRLPSQRLWANRWKEQWWIKHYPSVVQHDNRIYAFPHMLRRYFTVGIYPVPAGYRPVKPLKPRKESRVKPYWRDSVSSRENIQAEILLEH